MGFWDGIENAKVFERGNYMPPGFRGVVQVKRTLRKETEKVGVAFIVEFDVLEVHSPGDPDHDRSPVSVGERRSWFQKMTDKTVAFPAIAGWAAACAGFPAHDKKGIEKSVAPVLVDTMTRATDSPDKNDFTDVQVILQTSAITTKKGNEFTRHDFAPKA